MQIRIGNYTIENKSSAFIIAELSANHRQDFDIAVKSIVAAKRAGANAVKLQTYTPETITIDCNNEYFTINQGTLWDGKTLYELYGEAYTPWEWHSKLKEVAIENDIILFSSPFDHTAVDFLENLNVPAYKIASFEITDIPLIEYVASKGKPVIISTGIATLDDIQQAVNACRRMNNHQIALLKCTSSYPTPLEEVNLLVVSDMVSRFAPIIIGLSDHTQGIVVPVAGVSLGARIIEKHFILERKLGGPDSAFSLEPHEFKQMVDAVRACEVALGKVTYELSEKVNKSRDFARSLFVVKDISRGEEISADNVRSIRPGHGLPPKHYKEVIGKRVKSNLKRGTPLSWEVIE